MSAGLLGIDIKTWGGIVLGAATVIGGAAALLVVAEWLRRWYRRTLGRRQDRYERLARLGTGAHLWFFASVLGEPPAMSRSFDAQLPDYERPPEENARRVVRFREHFFIDRDYYIQALCDPRRDSLGLLGHRSLKALRPNLLLPSDAGLASQAQMEERDGGEL